MTTPGPSTESTLTSPLLAKLGFSHAFFTRLGGRSEGPYASLSFSLAAGDRDDHVGENRAIAARALGVDTDKLLYLSQVHGVAAYEATGEETIAGTLAHEGDIVFSRSPRVACGVRTADCVPILLAQPSTGAVAAIHAGWRGAVADAAGIGVRLLQTRFGDAPVVAAIGPHISAQAFEIGPEVAVLLRAAAPDRTIVAMRDGRLTGDLAALVRASLERAGVTEIDHVAGCTVGEPTRFFSFRRDGRASGRHVSAIVAQ